MEDLIGEKMDGTPLVKPVEKPDTRNPAAVALSKGRAPESKTYV